MPELQQFSKWTLETIRSEGAMLNWLEELRFQWTATVAQAVAQIVEGKTVVLITDHDRKWFEHYITSTYNKPTLDRPMIPLMPL
ncbi:MAG: HobA family DNA replication regulator, partial [Sulfurimonadaceae bacterium]|nr:HobA family DNA replication regulator [Sulfurimonadaceae bacterium]